MKSTALLSLLLFFSTIGFSQPGLDETTKYIEKILNLGKGVAYLKGFSEYLTEGVNFDQEGNRLKIRVTKTLQGERCYSSFEFVYWIDNWEGFKSVINRETLPNNMVKITLEFKTKLQISSTTYSNCNSTSNNSYTNRVDMIVPTEKLISFEKAITHLHALYKEKNKEPF